MVTHTHTIHCWMEKDDVVNGNHLTLIIYSMWRFACANLFLLSEVLSKKVHSSELLRESE